MAAYGLVPLGEKKIKLFKGPVYWLDDRCSIKSIEAEDYGLITGATLPGVSDQISATSKCLYLSLDGTVDPERFCLNAATRLEYVLNGARESAVVCPDQIILFARKNKTRVEKIVPVPVFGPPAGAYSVKAGTDKTQLSGLFKFAGRAVMSEDKLQFSLRRFNQAVRRISVEDRVVDLSIAIESLLGAQSEISYQFALFSALACTDDASQRQERFSDFKNLYSWRSTIAHGNSIPTAQVQARLPELEQHCRRVINYAIFWLAQGKKMPEFSSHLKARALGSEPFYIPGA